ncbi:hypothetical protein C8J56DRAFT_1059422 [Mycena floridula]|nr:hypothetical protein C8J56DRAFT_1059422 [Mycena floridula]
MDSEPSDFHYVPSAMEATGSFVVVVWAPGTIIHRLPLLAVKTRNFSEPCLLGEGRLPNTGVELHTRRLYAAVSSLFLGLVSFPGVENHANSCIVATFHKTLNVEDVEVTPGEAFTMDEMEQPIDAGIMWLQLKGPESHMAKFLDFRSTLMGALPRMDRTHMDSLPTFRDKVERHCLLLTRDIRRCIITGDRLRSCLHAARILDRRLGTELVDRIVNALKALGNTYRPIFHTVQQPHYQFGDIQSLRFPLENTLDHEGNGEMMHVGCHASKDALEWMVFEGRFIWLAADESDYINTMARWENEQSHFWDDDKFRYDPTPLPSLNQQPRRIPQNRSSLLLQDLRTVITIFTRNGTPYCHKWLRDLHSPDDVEALDHHFPTCEPDLDYGEGGLPSDNEISFMKPMTAQFESQRGPGAPQTTRKRKRDWSTTEKSSTPEADQEDAAGWSNIAIVNGILILNLMTTQFRKSVSVSLNLT